MEKENILDKMAAVDFNKPINVTVSFDDSDEENSDFINIIKKEEEFQDTSEVKAEQINDKIKILNTQISKTTDEDKTKNVVNVKEVNDVLPSSSSIQPKICKTNSENTRTCDQTSVQTEQNVLGSSLIKEISKEDKLVSNNEKSVEIDVCVKNLLKSVATHLIHILQAQKCYSDTLNNKIESECSIIFLRSRFERIKYQFFNLSYSTVENIIVPQRHNNAYLQRFLKGVIELAKSKNVYITFEEILPIFAELMKWTEQKMKSHELDLSIPFETARVSQSHKGNDKLLQMQQNINTLLPKQSVDNSRALPNVTNLNVHNENSHITTAIRAPELSHILSGPNYSNSYFPTAITNMGSTQSIHSKESYPINNVSAPHLRGHLIKAKAPGSSNPTETAQNNLSNANGFPPAQNNLSNANGFQSAQNYLSNANGFPPAQNNLSNANGFPPGHNNLSNANFFPPRYIIPNPNFTPNLNNLRYQTPQNNLNHANDNAQSNYFHFGYPNRNSFTNTYVKAVSNNFTSENPYTNNMRNANENANSNCFQSDFSNGKYLDNTNVTAASNNFATEIAQKILTSATKNANTNLSQSVYPKRTAASNNLPSDTLQDNSSDPSGTSKRKRTTKSAKSCIYAAGPPWRQVTINVDSEILSQQNKQLSSNNTKALASKEPLKDGSTDQYYYAHSNQTNISGSGIQSQVNGRSAFSNSPSASLQNKFPTNPVIPSNHSVPAPPPYSIARNWQNQTTVTTQPYMQPIQQIHSETNNQRSPPETLRRASTDSGFLSPVHFNNGGLPTTPNTSAQEGEAGDLDLLITHVTSLNPKASYLEDGPCHVCNKITKNKCLGCFNNYYCSVACQQSDWKFHMASCAK